VSSQREEVLRHIWRMWAQIAMDVYPPESTPLAKAQWLKGR